MPVFLGKHWHHLPADEVLDLLDADATVGLDRFEVTHRQEQFGPNELTQQQADSPWLRFLSQFNQPLVYLLLAAVLITALLREWVDSGVIFGVVLVNAVIGFIQESKALSAIEALSRTMTTEATVVRSGQKKTIQAQALVPGDIVFLHSGDKVPADLRLVQSRELQVNESALTGESLAAEKHSETLSHDALLADRRNMAYSSTLVTYGTGVGVVTATGDDTEIGRISELISSAEVLATPLTRKITRFSSVLLYVIVGMGGLTFVVGILRGESWGHMFMAAVALAVGAIPEGLPAAVTIALSIGMARMAKRHAIIRKLPAVETLGSTTVICSDKTGTLTQNKMTVQRVMAADTEVAILEPVYDGREPPETSPQGAVPPTMNMAVIECLRAGALCNNARRVQTDDGWGIEGEPTEAALLAAASVAGLSTDTLSEQRPRVDTLSFESQHQYMATLHDTGAGLPRVVYLKGSVERILPRCEAALGTAGERLALDPDGIHERVHFWAAEGLRVLAFARIELAPDVVSVGHEDVVTGLTFLGLQGMADPPRAEAMRAVHTCQQAGIRVKMITGDHAGTATAIARQIGIEGADAGLSAVITGETLAGLSDFELTEVAEDTAIFARVAPEQKLRLVEALQVRGHVVAMTGDGVNDAPALRRADIGVAMGITGTEVAKEAADMVLADDNFSSIEAAVEEGRGVFDNLIKFITWTLPTNIGEGLVIMAAVLAGLTLPILPVQILWINMTTAVLLGLMLAFEPKEAGIMTRPPRDPHSPILSRRLVLRICIVGLLLLVGSFGLFEWALSNGASDAEARTVSVNVFVMGELFYLFNCRSLTHSMFSLGVFSNKWLLAGVGLMVVLQLLFTYAPTMNYLFHSAPIGLDYWLPIVGVGVAIYGVVGIEKWAWRRRAG